MIYQLIRTMRTLRLRIILTAISLCWFDFRSFSQTGELNFLKVEIPGNHRWGISDMDLAPDSNTLVIGTGQGPIYIWDCKGQELIKKFDIPGYYLGPRIEISPSGRHAILTKRQVVDWAPNKDKPIRFEILDLEAGNIVFRRKDIQDGCWSLDGSQFVFLKEGKIYFWDVEAGKPLVEEEEIDLSSINRSLRLDVVAYSIELHPNGKLIVASHLPEKDDIQNIARIRNDKKAQKTAVKYSHVVSFYDLKTGEKVYSTDDIFDIIYTLKFSRDKKHLLVYSLPHLKVQTGGLRQGYIHKVVAGSGEVTRTIFPSQLENPDFKMDFKNQYLGVVSVNTGKSPAPVLANVHNYETGRTVNSYSMDLRFGETSSLNTSAMVFLPDNETLIMAYGRHLGYWRYK
jgi:WD40 repeat protein